MNPSSVPLHSRPASSIEGRSDASIDATKLHAFSGTVYSRASAYQPLEAQAWSLSDGKRLFDLVCASVGFVVFFPFMVVIGLVVAATSPGPVFFRQKRTGRLGSLFTIYKFRTMIAEAENGPCITVQGDCRITPVGVLLRKFKLDELPQFVNVIKGDMSFIGPRPKLPHHESLHMPFRPGITGAATLAFRCEEELLRHVPTQDLDLYYARTIKPLKAKLDWEYMQRATWWSDLGLLWCTLTACLSSRSVPSPVIEFPGQV
ncbi:sugar transferase [Alloacidobacterium sp.]|uniref:sugar transferase n=1 Tax=Alloacidobacterium sp. TaxID=2951999 RepID=UPI002D6122DB|nr:sugar transferase [Alloacidobacterium sp.]HYK37558.1 sugar transferase [Alloacidobacterium sp.]